MAAEMCSDKYSLYRAIWQGRRKVLSVPQNLHHLGQP
jgi:hypothetical protein